MRMIVIPKQTMVASCYSLLCGRSPLRGIARAEQAQC